MQIQTGGHSQVVEGRYQRYAHQNDVDWESHSFGCQHHVQAFSVKALSIDEQAA